MGHFSKYIDKGDVRIRVKNNDILNLSRLDTLGVMKPDGSVVLVITNSGGKKAIRINSGLNIVNTITTTSEENWVVADVDSNRITLAKDSITTIILN